MNSASAQVSVGGNIRVTEVTDPEELAAFANRIGPGELLGTMPCREIDDVR
jgi:hypothetical protein